MSTTSDTTTTMNRQPSNYTATNGVRQTVHNNPIPASMIGDCIKFGNIIRTLNAGEKVTLRYEEGAENIELRVNLMDREVYKLSSSYERDWKEASD